MHKAPPYERKVNSSVRRSVRRYVAVATIWRNRFFNSNDEAARFCQWGSQILWSKATGANRRGGLSWWWWLNEYRGCEFYLSLFFISPFFLFIFVTAHHIRRTSLRIRCADFNPKRDEGSVWTLYPPLSGARCEANIVVTWPVESASRRVVNEQKVIRLHRHLDSSTNSPPRPSPRHTNEQILAPLDVRQRWEIFAKRCSTKKIAERENVERKITFDKQRYEDFAISPTINFAQ